MKIKNLIFITGLSGSGKSMALDTFEDLNYYVLDNIPPILIPDMAKLLSANEALSGLAVVIDRRCGELFDDFIPILNKLREDHIENFNPAFLLYLDCSRTEIIRRFKETRRKHPLTNANTSVSNAIEKEKIILEDVRANSDLIIDTTKMEPEIFRQKIKNAFDKERTLHKLNVSVLSFGFKYGMPLDADLVFDVRFLPNPYWVSGLKELTGKDQSVKDYVLSNPKTKEYLDKLYSLIDFTVPKYSREGKAYLTIGIGCTGGRHRSVAIAEELALYLTKKDYSVRVEHREEFRY